MDPGHLLMIEAAHVVLIGLIFAIFYSKDSNILMTIVWWIPFTVIAFIFNALTPLGKHFQFFSIIQN